MNLVSSAPSFFFRICSYPRFYTTARSFFFSPHKHLQMHRPQISELANESGRPPAYCRQPCLRTATHVLPGHVQKSEKRAGRVCVCGSGDWRKWSFFASAVRGGRPVWRGFLLFGLVPHPALVCTASDMHPVSAVFGRRVPSSCSFEWNVVCGYFWWTFLGCGCCDDRCILRWFWTFGLIYSFYFADLMALLLAELVLEL